MTWMMRAMPYHPRILDSELDALIGGGIKAIAIEGAKAVGKSATATERVETVFALEDQGTRLLLEADPKRILTAGAVLIDEWQLVPTTWNEVRHATDDNAPGLFLLTGSASAPHPGTHSGAGRILTLRMRPMTLPERDVEMPTVSLAALLQGGRPGIGGSTAVSLDTYVEEICRSGFPAIRKLEGRPLRAQLAGYIDRVIDRDVNDATGRIFRNRGALRRWLRAYGACTGTTASFETIRDAATPGQADKPAKSTTITYRDALEAIYVLDPVPAWLPGGNRIKELTTAEKHHLVDPALAVSILGLSQDALLTGAGGGVMVARDETLLGALFESLVTLGVRVFAQAQEAEIGHLRTQRGFHEIDLIVIRKDQRVIAVEVKLSRTVGDEDVKHLRWLGDRLGDNLLDAVVITTGSDAYRRQDGIAVVPAALLGP